MHRHVRDGMTLPDRAQTIAVIGAGLAGLACAQQLQMEGHAVTVFDQAQTPGGRMRHYSAEQWQCDHGAQYFTARDPAFAAVVDAWIDAGIAAPWQARIASWDGTQLRRSQHALMRYVGVPEMTAPARTLAAQLDVRLSAEVRALRRSRQGWRLSVSQAAAEHLFDTVLLAVPAPSAAGLLAQAAPALATIAEQVRMQPAWAVMAHFDAPIDPGYDALFVNAGALRWVARNSSKPARAGAETWLAHATAEWSQAQCDAMPGHVSASLVPELAALGLPVPQSCDAFFWKVASSDPALQLGCVWDAQLGLGMCGDWLAGGKVEGAWQSAMALARRVSAGDVLYSAGH
ncbi:NAD(P)-binding protein [Xanthomonas campestris pv. zingibericola]|uniref:NAD(P)/FAD-dependent oxidoreductase n=1 Tax=Xanthomonas TaxID=338 RepID=UPI0004DF2541|nr:MULTISPECIES: FAD-dependent oxidoreductase [Xanthomonas]AYO96224.1 FAD-dependent oxidoreductase [Xanthomonas axonopodis pv. commiphoreae]MBV6790935.1 NAD(P)-binding protein [Xanthomonas campestris pv. clerodendri]MBV6852622.1 NAD(P)-binding protein [Xanthomonas campestris pv. mirabilis]MBV6856142.1 NAD(P)-binding protein [Xanthomonas campestris pv. zingibericola]MBV6869559.1 NAD(P)-binding protein [Xanthomonas campestris pv. veroniae]